MTRRLLLIEAAVSIALIWAGLRVMPFLRLQRMLDRCVPLRFPSAMWRIPPAISAVNWAVTAISARFPPATCLVQALAAAAMLRRRGHACDLESVFGRAAIAAGARIEAHAWVECDGRVAIGACGVSTGVGGSRGAGIAVSSEYAAALAAVLRDETLPRARSRRTRRRLHALAKTTI